MDVEGIGDTRGGERIATGVPLKGAKEVPEGILSRPGFAHRWMDGWMDGRTVSHLGLGLLTGFASVSPHVE